MYVLLQFGGHETTTQLIGNGLLALLQSPLEMQILKDNPCLMETDVEEFTLPQPDSIHRSYCRGRSGERERGSPRDRGTGS